LGGLPENELRMRILNGWKEIAECLNSTERTAQRWERLGLPVRRVSKSRRSPIVAFHHEIEGWMRSKQTKLETLGTLQSSLHAFRATRLETSKLVEELRTTRQIHQRLLAKIHDQIRQDRTSSAILPSNRVRTRLMH
jgi:hypothetical protein